MCTEILTNESFTENRHPFLKKKKEKEKKKERDRENELGVLFKCNVQNLLNKDYLLICKMVILSLEFLC